MPITRTPIVDDDGTGTTGTVLDNAWKTELYNQIDGADAGLGAPVVIGHASGTTTLPTSENFSGYLGLGDGSLHLYDTLLIEIEMHYSTTPLLPSLALYFVQSSSYGILTFPTFGNPSGGFVSTRTYLRRHPTADWQMHVLSMGGGTTPAQQSTMPTIDGWSKSWAVVMNHGGIPAGQTLWWKWSVTKIAG